MPDAKNSYASMHSLVIGVVLVLLRCWAGMQQVDIDAQPGNEQEIPPYIVSEFWATMGREVDSARASIPTQLGPALYDFNLRWGAFKRRVKCLVHSSG